MEVLVLGATGTLGREVTAELLRRGHVSRAASRRDRPPGDDAVRWVRVDHATGAGLSPAVAGAAAVIDATNVRAASRSANDRVLVNGTRRVLEACSAVGGIHYVGISIVGLEHLPYGYYAAKLRQEGVIENGPAPWSLLRSTQFHALLDRILATAARLPCLALPPTIPAQPVDAADVAARLVGVAEGAARGRLGEIGGPRVQTLGELAEDWMRVRGRRKRLIRLPAPGRIGRALSAGALCTPDPAVGGLTFAQWLAAR